jgi:hypothetical protein
MLIKTTLNIEVLSLRLITRAAKRAGVSRSGIIISLLKKVMDDTEAGVKCGKRIRYQKRRDAGEWNICHLVLRPDEYEYFLDLRKLLKMSLSHILARAIKKFLNTKNKMNPTPTSILKDNYLYKNYVLGREVVDGLICWKLIWGFPSNKEILFPTSQ